MPGVGSALIHLSADRVLPRCFATALSFSGTSSTSRGAPGRLREVRRRGQYPVAKLIERYGRDAKLVDWKHQITGDCPRRTKASVAVLDQCGAHFPDLLRLQI